MEERKRELKYIPEQVPIHKQQRKSILITWVFHDMGRRDRDDTGLVESCQRNLGVASNQGWGKRFPGEGERGSDMRAASKYLFLA